MSGLEARLAQPSAQVGPFLAPPEPLGPPAVQPWVGAYHPVCAILLALAGRGLALWPPALELEFSAPLAEQPWAREPSVEAEAQISALQVAQPSARAVARL
jgi:hypothetical protein